MKGLGDGIRDDVYMRFDGLAMRGSRRGLETGGVERGELREVGNGRRALRSGRRGRDGRDGDEVVAASARLRGRLRRQRSRRPGKELFDKELLGADEVLEVGSHVGRRRAGAGKVSASSWRSYSRGAQP